MRRRFWHRTKKIKVYFFYDKETGKGFQPNEYKEVQELLKCGGIVLANFSFIKGRSRYDSSPLVWIKHRKFKTARNGNVFRYYDATK